MMIDKLVASIAPNFPADKHVSATQDPVSWYKYVASTRTMLVPPVRVLQTNMLQLDNFIEAVHAFEKADMTHSRYSWEIDPMYLDSIDANDSYGLASDEIRTLHEYLKYEKVSCDIETRRIEWEDNRILSICFGYDECNATVVYNIQDENMHIDPEVHAALQDLFNDTSITFVWHNGKFDCGRLKYLGNLDARIDQDTMLMHYACINEKRGTHGLKQLGQLYLQAPAWEDELDTIRKDWCKKNKTILSNFTFDQLPIEVLIPYTQRDCIATLRLYYLFKELARPGSEFIYNKLIEASNVYMQMELIGQRLDLDYLEDLEYDLDNLIEDATAHLDAVVEQVWNPKLYAAMTGAKATADTQFNVKSPKQLKWVLQEVLGYPVPSTDAAMMAQLLEEVDRGVITNPVAREFLACIGELRKYSKYMDTYVQGMREVVCRDSRVRGTFNLHGTETGRLSSSDPNMQNIPRNKLIKNLLVASPGTILLQLDYSQAELRVLAMLSQDPYLIQVYKDGEDLHNSVAASMFGKDYNYEQRQMAKTINFGIVFGRGPQSISETFGKSMAEARQIISRWFAPMPVLKAWIENRKRMANKGEPCITPLGRERHFVITNEMMYHIQNEYINTPIQSLASDFTLLSVLEIHKMLIEDGESAHITTSVHDSIILEVPDDRETIERLARKCIRIMEEVPDKYVPGCNVPFVADADTGYRWGEMTKLCL